MSSNLTFLTLPGFGGTGSGDSGEDNGGLYLVGPTEWSMTEDDEGHRAYKITFLVHSNFEDGPYNVRNCPGLPLPGYTWSFLDDVDIWAYCMPGATVSPVVKGEPGEWWTVEIPFSTKLKSRCADYKVEDPLMEPARISGDFTKRSEEAEFDRFGSRILTSSHEHFQGKENEWDVADPTVKIELNTLNLNLGLVAALMNTVNNYPMWGLPARCIRLAKATWEKKYHGLCYVYYTWSFEFEIRYDTWDRDLLDEGTKVLNGEWQPVTGLWRVKAMNGGVADLVSDPPNPNRFDPSHFTRFKSREGDPMRVVLDGEGLPHTEGGHKTTKCSACATAPVVWAVSGDLISGLFNIPFLYIKHANLGSGPVLGCLWQGSPKDDASLGLIMMQFVVGAGAGQGYWEINMTSPLQQQVFGDLTVRHDPAVDGAFACNGTNIFRDPNNELTMLFIEPIKSEPGKIHVEKYVGADLTLLGVPPIIS